jgi:hypothetical protein
MGKNKTTKSDGVQPKGKTQRLEDTRKHPKGAYEHSPQSPK